MSELRQNKIDAIDQILADNPDIGEKGRERLESLRAKFAETQESTRDRINSSFDFQKQLRAEQAERREQSAARREESKAFEEACLETLRQQTDLLLKIAARL
jgi:hypothetical protein